MPRLCVEFPRNWSQSSNRVRFRTQWAPIEWSMFNIYYQQFTHARTQCGDVEKKVHNCSNHTKKCYTHTRHHVRNSSIFSEIRWCNREIKDSKLSTRCWIVCTENFGFNIWFYVKPKNANRRNIANIGMYACTVNNVLSRTWRAIFATACPDFKLTVCTASFYIRKVWKF